ncbi:hypothetical protein [Micromonospora sp. NPDC047527]|uniref:hypothetical protein n=1 Tax=Micromonospora sp. NPDC047527 TaxID=3155144 RepID=UPI0033D142C2
MTTHDRTSAELRTSLNVTELGSARFRTARLDIQDVRDIEDILVAVAAQVIWQCSETSSMSPPKGLSPKSPFTVKTFRLYKAATLSELIEHASRGRLFHFEVEAVFPSGAQISVTAGEHAKKSRWLELRSTSSKVPTEFYKTVAILERAERRGQKWHYGTIAVVPNVLLFGALFLYGFVKAAIDTIDPESSNFSNQVAAAATVAFIAFAAIPMLAGMWAYLTASSVTLKSRFNAAPVWRKALAGLKWVSTLYRKDELLEQKMFIVATTSMFLTFVSIIVAVLAWVLPRN